MAEATTIGRQAVVLGAGMAGMAAARALVDFFERVLILERDRLPASVSDRGGVPQGKHVHVLLAGGEQALESLFPGLTKTLVDAGAVPLRAGKDLWAERAGYDPFPRRDFGWDVHWMTRALVEHTVRTAVQAVARIDIRDGCVASELVADDHTGAVRAVRWMDADGAAQITEADLIVDASGHARLTLDRLRASGHGAVPETTIGVDLAYATTIFAIPDDAPNEWKGVYCFPDVPASARGALLAPIEGHRWILTAAGRGDDAPPADPDAFMAFIRSLRRPTIHEAVKGARRVTDVVRFRFPESRHRHYDRVKTFPRGLLPIGDAICRFNPIYGQGMSVAAQEAVALREVLRSRAPEPDPLADVAAPFFAHTNRLIATPWANAALPDLAYPDTKGERPPDFAQRLAFGAALTELAATDAAVHKLTTEVQQLLKPREVYRDPALMSRVLELLGRRRP